MTMSQQESNIVITQDIIQFYHIFYNLITTSSKQFDIQLQQIDEIYTQNIKKYNEKLFNIQELSQKTDEKGLGRKILKALNQFEVNMVTGFKNVNVNIVSDDGQLVNFQIDTINVTVFTYQGYQYANIINDLTIRNITLKYINANGCDVIKMQLKDTNLISRSIEDTQKQLLTQTIIDLGSLSIQTYDVDKNIAEILKWTLQWLQQLPNKQLKIQNNEKSQISQLTEKQSIDAKQMQQYTFSISLRYIGISFMFQLNNCFSKYAVEDQLS
ncbi:Hypothetical_protein [Hexamita inflata]|uniref:Hypothetical_protein n=1 Tax=Hexamita inflata TaxID=28002 RepID=A0AA86QE68_9EUKA|nr:Hypothetical protein HINF_LOCUS42806 [Hexamita inflata]